MLSLQNIKANLNWILSVFILIGIALHLTFIPVTPLIILSIVIGIPFTLQITLNLLKGDLGADILAVIAFVTGVILEEYLAANLILFMLTGGEALEAYAMKKASSVMQALADRIPQTVHLKKGNMILEVPLSDLKIDDEIVVMPHEASPVDGVVIEGNSSMDEAYLTGEPYKVSKAPGATVLSGAINGDAALTIRATKLPEDSRYAQIMKVMEEAEQKRPTARRLADQIGAIFAPLSLIIAIAAWIFAGDAMRFLAVLVVATPCPLLIAIPITLVSAISMAAKNGIIIKDPTVLERLPTCETAIFDKTGTLTYGKAELTEILPAQGFKPEEVLRQVASLEQYSKHPLAGAILKAAKKQNLEKLKASDISEAAGKGLKGHITSDEIIVTSRKQVSDEIVKELPPTEAGLECIILINGIYAATFRFRDVPRADGKSFIQHLGPSHSVSKVMLVSGDRESEVAYLAQSLGITETLSSQSPEQKVEIVRAETTKAPTLFMGDGINDAPALATATVGIAFGQQSNVTSEAAGAVILDNTLEKVDELIHISTDMRKIMLQSALGGMALSVIAMGFAAAGYITPVAGALLQEVIDVVAIGNALRLTLGERVESDLHD